MPATLSLPAGLTERPLTIADAAAVTAVMAAQELADVGEVVIEEADIVGDWQRPGYDVAASTVGVFDGDTAGRVRRGDAHGDRGDAAVHPDHRGRGIGTALARWMQERPARRAPRVDRHAGARRAPPATGCSRRSATTCAGTAGCSSCPRGRDDPASAPLPEGYAVRAADRGRARGLLDRAGGRLPRVVGARARDLRASGRPRPCCARASSPGTCGSSPTPPARWSPWPSLQMSPDVRLHRPARHPQGPARPRARAGAARRRLRAWRARTAPTRSELSTDSRTGALGLYEKVGMVVTSNWVNRAIDV